MNVGEVQRLSVAVVVNFRTDAAGKPIALKDSQIKQIENLTREAMGFSEQRGDSLNVVNSQFTDNSDLAAELPFWKQPAFIDQLFNAGRWLLVLIVAFILYRKLVSPQLRRKAEQQKAAEEAAGNALRSSTQDEGVAVSLSKDELNQERKSQHRMSAEVLSQRIREMSENDPRVVALVIRQWMKDEL